jgi:hypothetical protein
LIFTANLDFGAYARYVLWRGGEALELNQFYTVPLDELPGGMMVEVDHIPIYAQKREVKIWPWWESPAKKKWLTKPRDVH